MQFDFAQECDNTKHLKYLLIQNHAFVQSILTLHCHLCFHFPALHFTLKYMSFLTKISF